MGCMMVFRAWAATRNFVDFLCRNKAIKTSSLDIGFFLYLEQFCQISEKIRENLVSLLITILFQSNTICDKLQFDTFKFISNRERMREKIMGWTGICIVFTTVLNQCICCTRLYFILLYSLFSTRGRCWIKQLLKETHTLHLKEQLQWCWTRWKRGCLSGSHIPIRLAVGLET